MSSVESVWKEKAVNLSGPVPGCKQPERVLRVVNAMMLDLGFTLGPILELGCRRYFGEKNSCGI